MLKITQRETTESGGFLEALTSVSTDYLHTLLRPYSKTSLNRHPDYFIVHKAPHLDEYLAELLFRASLPKNERNGSFMEMALNSDDDLMAQAYWSKAAVFGIGSEQTSGKYAFLLFDEHYSAGGRKEESCAQIVVNKCYTQLPKNIQRIVDEANIIDSQGGAHPLHLNNIMKTCHLLLYNYGTNHSGRRMSGKLTDSWKRAVVNAIISSLICAMEEKLDIYSQDTLKRYSRELLDRYSKSSPYINLKYFDDAIQSLRSSLGNIKIEKDEIVNDPNIQMLLLPIISAAACQVWGTEIGYFLLVHFWESEILKNIHYKRVYTLLEKSFAHHPPKPIYNNDLSIATYIIKEKKFTGGKDKGGKFYPAQYPSNLWVISCKHNNFALQPNKAIGSYISSENFGVGLNLIENTKEGTKVLFKGRHVPMDFWNKLVDKLQSLEPGLWYRVSDSAGFLINGTPAHRYISLSTLTLRSLAKICRTL